MKNGLVPIQVHTVVPTPRGCAAAYYPETNVLVSLDDTAPDSQIPGYKSIVVRLEPLAPLGPDGVVSQGS